MAIFNKILNKETRKEKELQNKFNLFFKEYKLNEETLIFYETLLKDSLLNLNINDNKSDLNNFQLNNKKFIKIENLQSIENNSKDLLFRQKELKKNLQEIEIEIQFIKLRKYEIFYSKIKNFLIYFYTSIFSLFITIIISFFAPKEKDSVDYFIIYLIIYFWMLFIVFREKKYKDELDMQYSFRKLKEPNLFLFKPNENLEKFKNR